MKLSEAFPSKYLKSEDLQDRDVTVVIAGTGVEEVGDENKLILTFQGKKKSMICNKTNASRIAYLYGDETDEWIGKEIVLTSEFVEFQGKTVKGLRVKPPVKRDNISTASQRMASTPLPTNGRNPQDAMDEEIPF